MNPSNKSRIGHLESLTPAPLKFSDGSEPLRPELFEGMAEARPGRETGLTQFGVNYVTLEPGAATALRHWHEGEDEFVLVLTGTPTLVDDHGDHPLTPGSYVGFPAGEANAHQVINRSSTPVSLLVMGSRCLGADVCHYPDDPLGPIRR